MNELGLTADDLAFLEELDENRRFHRMDFFKPYPKQRAFIALGKTRNERCIFAGNRLGKSEVGAYETSVHLTGLYPSDWPGRYFDHPIDAWAAGESTTVVRDVQQEKLFGRAGVDAEFGTGFVPRHAILGKPTMARGAVSDAYDTASVLHFDHAGTDDGVSTVQFKSYEQGRKKFQGAQRHFVWWDEEPDEDVYTEGNARWSSVPDGCSITTFTPLQGMTALVKRYRDESNPMVGFIQMGVRDAPHMTDQMVKDMLSKYPMHQWRARMDGLPMLGSGQIFMVPEASIRFMPGMHIPDHWLKLWGLDFGIGHNFAAVLCAYDPEGDVFYVLKTFRIANAIPITHTDAILRIAGECPVAWPHDGTQRDKGGTDASTTLAMQYRTLGLKMMSTHAQWPTGGYSTEAAVLEMQQRMADGRFKVSAELEEWFEEFRMYHRELDKTTGASLIVKRDDDLLSATMKAIMMKRSGRPGPIGSVIRRAPMPGQKRKTSRTDFDLFTGQPFRD